MLSFADLNTVTLLKRLLSILFFIASVSAYAQEESNCITVASTKYVNFKAKSLHKYDGRIASQQKLMLDRLSKKEKRFAGKLKRSDSAAYTKYMQQALSYDSIKKLSNTDLPDSNSAIAKKKNGEVDSLRKITAFAGKESGQAAGLASKTQELDGLQAKLNYRRYINDLITKRTATLKGLAASAGTGGFKGIEKQVYYAKAKMKVFKEMEEEPTVAEEKALEYLQGTEGFDKAMAASAGGGGNAISGMDASQLQKMGYQTKQLMQSSLTDKFGTSLGGVTGRMGNGIKSWQDKQKDIKGRLKDAKGSLSSARKTEKPSFKVNPMRGLPFIKRLEKQYSWQTQRASDPKPATIELSAGLGFKHTPKLTYGVGITTTIGLGQGWQQIHLSFEGVGYKTFATWAWQYGLGAYAGYERTYKRGAFIKEKPSTGDLLPTTHSTQVYTESILVGLNKTYSISTKYKGSIQLLYDIWWQQKGSRSPVVLRFVTLMK